MCSMSKNLCAKTVKPENAYEVWKGDGWTWRVLKKYQNEENEAKNPYARWFCEVESPYAKEMGDVYVAEVKRYATRVS